MPMSSTEICSDFYPDGFKKAGGSGGPGAVGENPHFNLKEATSTLVISNSSTCTLKVQSSGAPRFMKKKNSKKDSTYTVQFNKETTKTTKTTSSEVQIVGPSGSTVAPRGSQDPTATIILPTSASDDLSSTAMGKGHAAINVTTATASTGGIISSESRPSGTPNSTGSGIPSGEASTPSSGGPQQQQGASGLVKSTSSKPCCFCWCCCCSCSWIRRRCLSVRAPNGSLENANEIFRDEELGNITAIEVKSWGDAFEKLMNSDSGRKVFRSFLRCEYSEENILFWLACEDLKKERSPEMIEEKARIIYEDYVSILSPREVSLDSRVRDIINRNMIAPSQHTFDEAQLQIYTLMHRDSYPRFVNSSTYKNLLRTVGVEPESSTSS